MSNPEPDGIDTGKLFQDIVANLLPLYDDCTELDSPSGVLCHYPDTERVIEALKTLIDFVLPGRITQGDIVRHGLEGFLLRRVSTTWGILQPEIEKALSYRWRGEAARCEGAEADCIPFDESLTVMRTFLERLPEVRAMVIEDIKSAYEGDPAALSYAVVQIAYPGLLAIVTQRIAHELYVLDVPLVPRIMSEWAHTATGADIHPGARIGHGLFIDHSTGVVIGETAQIGNRVKIYQGVTIGAKSFPLDEQGRPIKHIKRHPTVEDDVIIYANAIILGGETVIGRNTTIGGNVFLSDTVPPNSLVSNHHPELTIKAATRSQQP